MRRPCTACRPLALLAAALLALPAAASATARGGAMLRSALLPGWGQMSLGRGTRGAVFMGVEAITWAGFGLAYLEGVWGRDDYRWLAMEEAGVSAAGRSGDFLDDLADFDSSAEYNDYIHRLARYYYPDDPDAQRDYYEAHAREGGESWSWSSEAAREEYADRLRSSRDWFRRSLYIAAFALVNRAVSVIDASLLDETRPGLYTSLEFPGGRDPSGVRFSVGARF